MRDGKKYQFDEQVEFSALGNNKFKESYAIGNSQVHVEALDFIPNPGQVMVEDDDGRPIIKMVMGERTAERNIFLSPGKPSTCVARLSISMTRR
jgi:hypothetical protein